MSKTYYGPSLDELSEENQKRIALRDYFAGQVIGCILGPLVDGWDADEIAKDAYEIADAMMKARVK